MSERKTLLVGSMPFANEREAMHYASQVLGPSLISLPDGEIGEKTDAYPNGKRAAWVMTAIDRCTLDTDTWNVVRPGKRDASGFPVDYDHVQRLRPKRSRSELPRHLDFGYHNFFFENYPIFKEICTEKGLSNLKFQVGVPTGLGITISMMHPLLALWYADAFNERIAWEVNQILKSEPEDVVIQIELPAEVAWAYKTPGFMIGVATRSVLGLVKRLNKGAHVGLHLCLGDLNNEALVEAKTLDKIVLLTNNIVKHWPADYRLEYVHFPLAEAATPPPLDPDYYTPLGEITLPTHTRFVAGFVHDKRDVEELGRILEQIETVRDQPVDIACSCGLGRRTTSDAKHLMRKMSQLAGA